MSILKTTLVALSLSFAATAAFADASVPVQDTPVLKQNSQAWSNSQSNARAAFASTQAAPKTWTNTGSNVIFSREYMESHNGH